jgi:hypothetical protein
MKEKKFKLEVVYNGKVYSLNLFNSGMLKYAKESRPNDKIFIFNQKEGIEVRFKNLEENKNK